MAAIEIREAEFVPPIRRTGNPSESERALKAVAKSRTGIAYGRCESDGQASAFAGRLRNFIKRNKLGDEYKVDKRGDCVYITQRRGGKRGAR